MEKCFKRLLCVLLSLTLALGSSSVSFATSSESNAKLESSKQKSEDTSDSKDTGDKEKDSSDNEKEKNVEVENLSTAVMLMNFLTINTQEVYNTKDRYKINEIYDFLLDDGIKYKEINGATKDYIVQLTNDIFAFKMLDLKRNRVDFLHEQITSNMIAAALKPDPIMSIGTAIVSNFENPVAIGISIGATLLNSAVNAYNAYSETEQEYIKNNWELEDEELKTVHDVRQKLFKYKATIVSDYNIKDEKQVLENKQVEEYVKWQNMDNNNLGRIQHFESNKEAYKGYPMFWLVLAKSYYINKDYQKCIDAIENYNEYNKSDKKIFRHDRDFATTIQYGISSARNIMNDKDYVNYVNKYVPIIENELTKFAIDWEMNFKASLYYIDLYNKTNDKTYLEKAYEKTKINVNELANEQREENKKYLLEYKPEEVKADASEKEKKEIEEYNKYAENLYKTQLPPVSGPLVANLDVLFELCEKLNIINSEKETINKMLHPSGESLFMCSPIEKKYYLNDGKEHEINNFRGRDDSIIDDCWYVAIDDDYVLLYVPIQYLLDESIISVSFKDSNNVERLYEADKPTLDEVDRKTGFAEYSYYMRDKDFSLPDSEFDVSISVDVKGDESISKITKDIKVVKMRSGYEGDTGGKCDYRGKKLDDVFNELLSYGYKEDDIEFLDFDRTKFLGLIPNFFENNKDKKVQDVLYTTNGRYRSGNAKLDTSKKWGSDSLAYKNASKNGYYIWGREQYMSLNNHVVICFWK